MSKPADLATARAQARRKALSRLPEWSAADALEAALCDIRTGKLKPEALMVVYATDSGGGIDVGTYIATQDTYDDAFWLAGMLRKAERILLEDEG